jgi:hypothetical protein
MALDNIASIRSALKPQISLSKYWGANTANLQCGFHSTWANATGGSNLASYGAGSFNGTLNGAALSGAVAGQMPWLDRPVSGEASIAAVRIGTTPGGHHHGGLMILADRIWHNGGFNLASASAQAIVTPTFPARDVNGSSDGEGYFLCLEIATTTVGGPATISVSYTNSDGVAGRTSTLLNTGMTATGVGRVFPMTLQAGDKGIRSIESATLGGTAYSSGTIALVVYRPLAFFPFSIDLNRICALDPINVQMPSITRGAVLYLLGINGNSNAGSFNLTSVSITPAWE